MPIYVPEHCVHHFTGWSYRHASGAPHTLKPYGIYQVGLNATPPGRGGAHRLHAGERHYYAENGAYTAAFPRVVDRSSPGVC